MLLNLLPGLREIRAPLISGYLWLTFFFLALHEELPSSSHPGAALEPIFSLAEDLSAPVLVAVTGIAAYLVGSAMQELWKLVGRFVSPARPLYGEAGIRTSPAGRRDIESAVRARVQTVGTQLAQVALSPGEKGVAEEPDPATIEQELPLIRTLLLGERPELVGELDRLQAEADLRITVAFPLAFLAAHLAGGASVGWAVLFIPALLLLLQGYQRQLEGGDLLAKALKIGKADAPSLEALANSADAALERVELEADLRRRMDDGDGLAAFQLGNLQARWDDFDSAATSLEFAVDQRIVRAYVQLGWVHERRGDDTRAERAYRDGEQRRDKKARAALAALLRRLDRDEEARATASEGEDEAEVEKAPAEPGREEEYRTRMEAGDPKAAINLGLLLRRRGDEEEAVEVLRRATELGAGDSQAWLELARAQVACGAFFDAEGPLERALELQERQLGPDHLDIARTLHIKGLVAVELGQYARARDLFWRELQIKRKHLGPEHPDVARASADVAGIEVEFDELETARKMEEEALAVLKRTLPPGDAHIARITGNLGWTHRELGHLEQALSLVEEAMLMEEEVLDMDSTPFARTLNSMGAILGELGQEAKARTHLARAERILRNAGSGSAQYLAEALRDSARLLTLSGRPDQALELCEEASDIESEKLGPRHPKRALTLLEEGLARRHLGTPGLARDTYKRALEILEEHPKRSAVALALRGLGETRSEMGDDFEAERLLKQAIQIQGETLPAEHPELTKSYQALARTLQRLGRPDEAAEAHPEAG